METPKIKSFEQWKSGHSKAEVVDSIIVLVFIVFCFVFAALVA